MRLRNFEVNTINSQRIVPVATRIISLVPVDSVLRSKSSHVLEN
eukprot:COSAG05_NODE_15698_length_363_cov_1.375000_1_plen_43_part_01